MTNVTGQLREGDETKEVQEVQEKARCEDVQLEDGDA
jgi:hypothetical protein